MLIRKADRQLRGLQRVTEACRLDAVMQDLAVGQHKDLLPGTGHPLHIHHKNAVGGEHGLIAHGLVGPHDLLTVQQQLLHIFADLLFLDADEVLHRLFPKFHNTLPFRLVRMFGQPHCSISGGG